MTQQVLAARIGVRFQQVQKYETAQNRVSASRLWKIAKVQGVPVDFYYHGLKEPQRASKKRSGVSARIEKTMAADFIQALSQVPGSQRTHLIALAKSLGAAGDSVPHSLTK